MNERSSLLALLFTASAVAVTGCGGGGGGSPGPAPVVPAPPPPSGSPTIQVSPTSYDFGKVTTGNTPAALEVTVSNSGKGPLTVSGISLLAPSGPPYSLIVNGGSKPCGSATPTVAAGTSCTVQVSFQTSTPGTFASTLQVNSNGANGAASTVQVPISATAENIASLTVRINQLETSCPGSNAVTAYVSVIDQGGYPVLNLTKSDFLVTENTAVPADLLLADATYVSATSPAATAVALDHSGSITDQPVAFNDMLNTFSDFFTDLRAGDQGEVIKFDSVVEVVQPFTTDRTALQTAITTPFDMGIHTKLYDGTYQGVVDAGAKSGFRKFVIVATDGKDEGDTNPYSTKSLTDVINAATSMNVAIFTVGIGTKVNPTTMEQMAAGTGGLFYEASTSENLATISRQLSSLLYQKQYVLTFDQLSLGPSTPSSVTIRATSSAVSGSDTRPITSCN